MADGLLANVAVLLLRPEAGDNPAIATLDEELASVFANVGRMSVDARGTDWLSRCDADRVVVISAPGRSADETAARRNHVELALALSAWPEADAVIVRERDGGDPICSILMRECVADLLGRPAGGEGARVDSLLSPENGEELTPEVLGLDWLAHSETGAPKPGQRSKEMEA